MNFEILLNRTLFLPMEKALALLEDYIRKYRF